MITRCDCCERDYSDISKHLKTKKHQKNAKDVDECCICAKEIYNDRKITECNHLFHRKCLKEWSKYKNNCPLCREELGKNFPTGSYINFYFNDMSILMDLDLGPMRDINFRFDENYNGLDVSYMFAFMPKNENQLDTVRTIEHAFDIVEYSQNLSEYYANLLI